jgi:enolase
LVDTLIKPELLGENALEQERLDALLREIDGTKNYSRIGGTRPW